jgi:acyl carrier protein
MAQRGVAESSAVVPERRPGSLPLETRIKALIIETLRLPGITPDEIETEGPLFNDGLGLDSIDAIQLSAALRERFGVRLAADEDSARKILYSVATLTAFFAEHLLDPGDEA